jgi:hypothetical protein
MNNKDTLDIRKKLNILALNHNRLTTLCAHLLNEVNGLKKELASAREGSGLSSSDSKGVKVIPTSKNKSSNYTPNFSELKADEILKQLSMNNPDN